MSTLKISKHSDVPTALDLVQKEVDKESRRIFSAGGDALKAGNIKPAKEAIAYAGKLAPNMTKYLAVFQNENIPQAYGISGQGLNLVDNNGILLQ